MTARCRFYSLVAAVMAAGAVLAAVSAPAHQTQASLDPMLQPSLAKYDLPALAAAVVVDGKVVAAGAVGTRRVGTKLPVTVNDRFHLGSDTKAMTALLAAMYVEAGKLRWDSTVADVLPDLIGKKDALARVTLEQLLSHSSGVPSDNDDIVKLIERATLREENLDEARSWVVRQWSKQPLGSKPGTRFAYANMNYLIAGAMIERVGGKTWEELIRERVFAPLELRSAGLGPQATLGKIDAPLGHRVIDKKAKAFLAGPGGDNTPVIGPAGNAHMSVLDFARWAGWNAGQGKRGPALVKPETLKKLHTPVIDTPEKKDARPGTPTRGKYGLGWLEAKWAWAPEPLLMHGGSNGMNLAHVWIDPRRDYAMVLVTNVGGAKADEALMALAPGLYAKFAPKRGGGGAGKH